MCIDQLLIGRDLKIVEAESLFRTLFNSAARAPDFCKLILVLLQKKGEHANELAGLVRTIRKLEKPPVKHRLPNLVDGCGTGGDKKGTFNISTISCLIAAGTGVPIAKHGNRSISSRCGSSDLMQALGVNINASPRQMVKALTSCGFGYFHAPIYHPTFRRILPIRLALGRKKIMTIFNLTGQLVNPLRPSRQLVGAFRKAFAYVLAQAIRKIGIRKALIVWNRDGYDELTTTSNSSLLEVNQGKMKRRTFSPTSVGLQHTARKHLRGGNRKVNAAIARRILSGLDRGPRRDTVLLNAGAIVYVSGKAKNIRQGIDRARASLDSGAARLTLDRLITLSHDSR